MFWMKNKEKGNSFLTSVFGESLLLFLEIYLSVLERARPALVLSQFVRMNLQCHLPDIALTVTMTDIF